MYFGSPQHRKQQRVGPTGDEVLSNSSDIFLISVTFQMDALFNVYVAS